MGANDILKNRRADDKKIIYELSKAMYEFFKKKINGSDEAFKNNFIYALLKRAILKKMLGFNGRGWEIVTKEKLKIISILKLKNV